jgi:hypothetical protein
MQNKDMNKNYYRCPIIQRINSRGSRICRLEVTGKILESTHLVRQRAVVALQINTRAITRDVDRF